MEVLGFNPYITVETIGPQEGPQNTQVIYLQFMNVR